MEEKHEYFIYQRKSKYFIFLVPGSNPEQWMLEAGEYTMKRFAGLYGMEYGGMATNGDKASKLFKA